MYNITVGRLAEHPEAQGVIKPADDSWQLVIDKGGFPHLWVRVKTEDGKTGYVPTEMFMQDGMGIKDIMLSTFGGEVLEGPELEEAEKDWAHTKEQLGIPCPV
jgi:hypothetical protein